MLVVFRGQSETACSFHRTLELDKAAKEIFLHQPRLCVVFVGQCIDAVQGAFDAIEETDRIYDIADGKNPWI